MIETACVGSIPINMVDSHSYKTTPGPCVKHLAAFLESKWFPNNYLHTFFSHIVKHMSSDRTINMWGREMDGRVFRVSVFRGVRTARSNRWPSDKWRVKWQVHVHLSHARWKRLGNVGCDTCGTLDRASWKCVFTAQVEIAKYVIIKADSILENAGLQFDLKIYPIRAQC